MLWIVRYFRHPTIFRVAIRWFKPQASLRSVLICNFSIKKMCYSNTYIFICMHKHIISNSHNKYIKHICQSSYSLTSFSIFPHVWLNDNGLSISLLHWIELTSGYCILSWQPFLAIRFILTDYFRNVNSAIVFIENSFGVYIS